MKHQIIGSFIKAKRKENKVSQVVLAAKLGCAQSYISRIEQGKLHLELVDYIRFCKAIGVAPEELLKNIVAGLESKEE